MIILSEDERQEAMEQGVIEIDGKWFRKEENGDLTEMVMHDIVYGWLSSDELFELRQSKPRMAP